jgi:hypothetical protein
MPTTKLHARLMRLRLNAFAEFERLIAHVDERDPDQVALVKPQIDALLARLKEDVEKTITGVLISEAIKRPMQQLLGGDAAPAFASGGVLGVAAERSCAKHGAPLVLDAGRWQCLLCNTEAIDALAAKPGTISIVATVRGDCGLVHRSFEEWQACQACAAIGRSRRAP